jgi:tetratricopeptide (TPR) repeat protein
MKAKRWMTSITVGLLALGGCAPGDGGELEASPASAMFTLTTSSDAARAAFIEGEGLRDVGAPNDAQYAQFAAAVQADPSFALAHLRASQTAPTVVEGETHRNAAVAAAANAGAAERLVVQVAQKRADGDIPGALTLAEELSRLEPTNPRAWVLLAQTQQAALQTPAARTSLARAVELAPDFVQPRILLGEMRGQTEASVAEAETHAQRAIELAPEESYPYDVLGDIRRQQNRLPEAADAYTRAAELAPTLSGPLQQRAHVKLFMDDFDGARADYGAAVDLEKGNSKVSHAANRALVGVFAGDPRRTVDELEQLVAAVDGMGVPDPADQKINALVMETWVAAQSGLFDRADAAVRQLSQLWTAQADEVGTDPFRRARAADVAYMEGVVAAMRGRYDLALRKADESSAQLAPLQDSRKDERALILRGLVAVKRGQWESGITALDQALATYLGGGGIFAINQVLEYHRALALDGAGRTEEAQAIYRSIGTSNFVNIGIALFRADARAKANL